MITSKNLNRPRGFTLVELLVAFMAGLLLVTAMAQVLLAESGQARRLGRVLRERASSQRALSLIASELEQAVSFSRTLPVGDHQGCGLAGRDIRLYLQGATGPIIYSVERKPLAIWRGRALMRCGPAYGLHGQLHAGTNQSSVLIDAVTGNTLSWDSSESGALLSLERSFAVAAGKTDVIEVSQAVPDLR
jgi:type II secretory pathway pseudopilin PulG